MEKLSLNIPQPNIKIDKEKYDDLRHRIHMDPEIRFQEVKTKKKLRDMISTFKNADKIKFTEVKESGFFFDILGEKKSLNSDPVAIGFRADMDALQLVETTNVPWKSKNEGVSHSCGHDGHVTMITAFLEYIMNKVSEIPDNVKLRFIYQPAEEEGNGAKDMIAAGCCDGITEIYALHDYPLIPVGTFGVIEGAIMAGANFFKLTIKGKGGHGSTPHLCNSPITTACEIINKINSLTSQKIDPSNRCVISFGSIQSGEAGNIIPEQAEIKGTVRSFNNENMTNIRDIMKSVCEEICKANSCTYTIEEDVSNCTVNDPKLTKEIGIKAIQKSGFNLSTYGLPMAGSEDFAYYNDKIPGIYVFVGTGDENHTVDCHNPAFDFNDLTTPYGVEWFIRVVELKTGINFLPRGNMIERVFSKNLPKAIGPYSIATKFNNGKVEYFQSSGLIGIDLEGRLVSNDIVDQANMVFTYVNILLKENGYTYSDIIKVTLFLTDMKDFNAVNLIYLSYFEDTGLFSARSCIQVVKLPKDAKIEMECTAVKRMK